MSPPALKGSSRKATKWEDNQCPASPKNDDVIMYYVMYELNKKQYLLKLLLEGAILPFALFPSVLPFPFQRIVES